MTDISAKQTLATGKYSWRVVDIVLAALIAVAGGVIFWAWDQGANLVTAPLTAVYPPLTGLYAELIFAAFLYKKFNLPVSLLAGAGAGLFCGLNDSFLPWGWNIAYEPGDKLAYIVFCAISGAVIAGGLSWLATRGLAKTGVLASFASRKAASEPVFS